MTKTSIQRYRAGEERLEPDPQGPWVRYEDYENQAMLLWRAEQRAIEMEQRYDNLALQIAKRATEEPMKP